MGAVKEVVLPAGALPSTELLIEIHGTDKYKAACSVRITVLRP
jgi:hypothetical protein